MVLGLVTGTLLGQPPQDGDLWTTGLIRLAPGGKALLLNRADVQADLKLTEEQRANAQKKRLGRIEIQVVGFSAFGRSTIVQLLGLNEDQKDKLRKLHGDRNKESNELFAAYNLAAQRGATA